MSFKPSKLAMNVGSATSIEFNEMIYELLRRGKKPIILSYGEAPFDPIEIDFKFEIQKAGAHYSGSKGVPKLRRIIVEELNSNIDAELSSEDNILLTAGSKMGSYLAFLALVDPGDVVVLHEPAWVSYREHARLISAETRFISYQEDLLTGLIRIQKEVKPRILVINNPNNPRGKVYTEKELQKVIEYCGQENILVMIDESYSEYLVNEPFFSCTKLIENFSHVLVLQSISKDLGLSGWRIGYIIAAKEVVNTIVPLNQHLITCAPTVLQLALADNYKEIRANAKKNIAELMSKRELVRKLLVEYKLFPLEGNSTFYFFIDIGRYVMDVKKFCYDLLMEDYVSVIPGVAYGNSTSTFIRISFAAEPLDRIKAGLEKLTKKLGV